MSRVSLLDIKKKEFHSNYASYSSISASLATTSILYQIELQLTDLLFLVDTEQPNSLSVDDIEQSTCDLYAFSYRSPHTVACVVSLN